MAPPAKKSASKSKSKPARTGADVSKAIRKRGRAAATNEDAQQTANSVWGSDERVVSAAKHLRSLFSGVHSEMLQKLSDLTAAHADTIKASAEAIKDSGKFNNTRMSRDTATARHNRSATVAFKVSAMVLLQKAEARLEAIQAHIRSQYAIAINTMASTKEERQGLVSSLFASTLENMEAMRGHIAVADALIDDYDQALRSIHLQIQLASTSQRTEM